MKTNEWIILGERLSMAAEYVRSGAVLCDVGTDHAKLPLYLALGGKIKKALATDINEGPIRTAAANVAAFGVEDIVRCIRTDGLKGTEGLGVTDISICGMGGELIAGILSECDYIKDPAINLILQPMSHTEELRRYLYDEGFDIKDERLVREADKLYVLINASYCGSRIEYDDTDLVLGKVLKSREHDALFCEMAKRALYHLKNRMKSRDAETVMRAKALYEKLKEIVK